MVLISGLGDLDSYIVRECMPKLKQYYGEEPSEMFRQELEREMSAPSISAVEVCITFIK